MKLHPDPLPALNTVTAYGTGYVEINQVRYTHSILMTPDAPIRAWPIAAFSDLTAEHFAMPLEFMPELVIFGSGTRLRFPPAALTAALGQQRIGVETMDLQAACRTYNVLMAEGRHVAAALLIEAL